MMILFFIGAAFLLIVEGRFLALFMTQGALQKAEGWALGFPLGTAVNALLFYFFTISGAPLTALTVFGGHVVMLIVLGVFNHVIPGSPATASIRPRPTPAGLELLPPPLLLRRAGSMTYRVLLILLAIATAISLLYGIVHTFLPTFYYDSVSQWTMRAKISFFDQHIAFDVDELRGMSKPQYPILLHSLQIFFALAINNWSDLVANSAILILNLTSFLAMSVLLLRNISKQLVLLVLSTILTIPILAYHLGQGYGDLSLLAYLLLAAVALVSSEEGKNTRMLLLASVMVGAASFVKQEGLVFGLAPFTVLLLLLLQKNSWKPLLMFGFLPAMLLSLLWPILLLSKGLPLSPHGGGDLAIAFHSEGVSEAFRVLFASGSFGVHWYIVIGLLVSVSLKLFYSSRSALLAPAFTEASAGRRRKPFILILLWGVMILISALAIFLATANVQYLLNGQTFSRTMMIPLALLLLGTLGLYAYTDDHEKTPQAS